jgi:hypothetical protein
MESFKFLTSTVNVEKSAAKLGVDTAIENQMTMNTITRYIGKSSYCYYEVIFSSEPVLAKSMGPDSIEIL